MMELLVLGLVPGTNVRLTFSDVLRLGGLLGVSLTLLWQLRHYKLRKALTQADKINRLAL